MFNAATSSPAIRFFSFRKPYTSSPLFPLPKPLLLRLSPISFQTLIPSNPPRPAPPCALPASHRDTDLDPSVLPPSLQQIIVLFRSVSDPRAKYQQLLHYGSKLPPFDPSFKTDDNRVRGCVSRVWVRAFRDPEDPSAVRFEADSDAALTRGLAALLVLGLSGNPPEVVASVPPEFVLLLGIRQSLSESRNNGFLNMLRLMQRKALELETGGEGSVNDDALDETGATLKGDLASNAFSDANGSNLDVNGIGFPREDAMDWNGEEAVVNGGTYGVSLSSGGGLGGRAQRIRERLERELTPVELEVEDISHMHAGHAAIRGSGDGETHFNVKVVSDKFEGKSLVKRHRLVYDLLQEELQSGLHALSIVAKTPSERQT